MNSNPSMNYQCEVQTIKFRSAILFPFLKQFIQEERSFSWKMHFPSVVVKVEFEAKLN